MRDALVYRFGPPAPAAGASPAELLDAAISRTHTLWRRATTPEANERLHRLLGFLCGYAAEVEVGLADEVRP